MSMRTITTIMIFFTAIGQAQDVLTFESGQEYKCETISYHDGTFTVKLPDGSIKKAGARVVQKINFAPNAEPLKKADAPETEDTVTKESGFRSAKWGMSRSEVLGTEPDEPVKKDTNLLMYRDSVGGQDAYALFIFVQDRLVRGKYAFADGHTNKNDFIQDFMGIKKVLIEKYGKPKDENISWRNDLYRNDRDQWGLAISVGHLTYLAEWNTADTEIIHILYGENFEINHVIEYTSKALKSLEDEEKRKKNLEKF